MGSDLRRKVADLVSDAGGEIVGRTRLQKIVYLLTNAGLEEGFSFSYRHYGPYSEELAEATRQSVLFKNIAEDKRPASWGGTYSVYSSTACGKPAACSDRSSMLKIMVEADSIELELAATALYFDRKGFADPWAETARQKPEKARDGRIIRAKQLYRDIQSIHTPIELPTLN
jgi:uncharacterized protein YwgA